MEEQQERPQQIQLDPWGCVPEGILSPSDIGLIGSKIVQKEVQIDRLQNRSVELSNYARKLQEENKNLRSEVEALTNERDSLREILNARENLSANGRENEPQDTHIKRVRA